MTQKTDLLKLADNSKHWELRKSPVDKYLPLIKKNFGSLNNKRLLDIGCGTGVEVNEFNKRGIKAEGLDVKSEFIEEAKKEHPELIFNVGGAENLPFENEVFDIVFSINTLFYTDLTKSIPEMVRILKKSGIAVVSFDTEIINLDTEKIFHSDSLDNLKKMLAKVSASIVYLGRQEKRLDKTPFRHQHSFHKIIFKKTG